MDKVRVGVIGLGNMGGFHAKYMNSVDGACLGAICDNDADKLNKFAKQYDVPAFTDYKDMIASGKIDAVLIATPHYAHPDITLAAFAKGLHVLSEKPIGVLVKRAREVNEAYKNHPNLTFAVMFQQRTSSMYQKLRKVIADGELGEITRVTWLITDWFRTWTYYASGGWRATWSGEGGGVLINQCPHNLDLIQWITGLMPNRITAVGFVGKTHPIEVEDEVSAIMEYPNGAIGHFVTTTGEAPGTNRLEICGDRGKIVAEKGKLLFSQSRQSIRHQRETNPNMFFHPECWDLEIPYDKAENGHQVVTQNFINAIRKGTPLIAPGIEGIRGLEIGAAMQMSGLTRRPVELPMDGDAQEQFLKDMAKQYGGRKVLESRSAASADMGASFAKA